MTQIVSARKLVGALGHWSTGSGALNFRLAEAVDAAIRRGEFPAGSQLPPERQLAETLHVSRSTIVSAYELLRARGAIETRQGSGTYVRPRREDRQLRMGVMVAPREVGATWRLQETANATVIDLSTSRPTPLTTLLQTSLRDVANDLDEVMNMATYSPQGLPVLRAQIAADYTRRGWPTTVDQILITSGGQQALALMAGVWLRSGASVVVENPSYLGALDAFRRRGARLINIVQSSPEEAAGELARLIQRSAPSLVYFMAGFNYITGQRMSDTDRVRILKCCAEQGSRVIEDQVMDDLDLQQDPDEQVQASIPFGEVATLGSVSKLFWSGLRIGWIRGSTETIQALLPGKTVMDLGTSPLTQALVARLLPIAPEVRLLRAAETRHRLEVISESLRDELPEFTFDSPEGGRSLWLRLPEGSATDFVSVALRHGVTVTAGPELSPDRSYDDRVRILVLHEPSVLEEAVRRLASAWRAYLKTI